MNETVHVLRWLLKFLLQYLTPNFSLKCLILFAQKRLTLLSRNCWNLFHLCHSPDQWIKISTNSLSCVFWVAFFVASGTFCLLHTVTFIVIVIIGILNLGLLSVLCLLCLFSDCQNVFRNAVIPSLRGSDLYNVTWQQKRRSKMHLYEYLHKILPGSAPNTSTSTHSPS